MNFRFQNRAEAGRLLADKLESYAGQRGVVVLGLARGGVPVAFEVSQKLHCPLYAFIVRKLGVPGQEELAMGAIASGGVCFLNQQVIRGFRIPQRNIDQVVARERKELERREELYSIGPPPELGHRMVILVDDGLATGASMRAAVKAVQQQNPLRVVVAAPVAALETYLEFQREVDDIVCVQTPQLLEGVGQWYVDFSQTSDEEVRALLERNLRSMVIDKRQLQEDI